MHFWSVFMHFCKRKLCQNWIIFVNSLKFLKKTQLGAAKNSRKIWKTEILDNFLAKPIQKTLKWQACSQKHSHQLQQQQPWLLLGKILSLLVHAVVYAHYLWASLPHRGNSLSQGLSISIRDTSHPSSAAAAVPLDDPPPPANTSFSLLYYVCTVWCCNSTSLSSS